MVDVGNQITDRIEKGRAVDREIEKRFRRRLHEILFEGLELPKRGQRNELLSIGTLIPGIDQVAERGFCVPSARVVEQCHLAGANPRQTIVQNFIDARVAESLPGELAPRGGVVPVSPRPRFRECPAREERRPQLLVEVELERRGDRGFDGRHQRGARQPAEPSALDDAANEFMERLNVHRFG